MHPNQSNHRFCYITRSTTILGDLYTPVGVYLSLRDLYPQSVLMESSDYHDSNNSRSFIGIHPMASVAISHGESISTFPDGSVVRHAVGKDYRSDHAINDFLKCFEVSGDEASYCGLYGYTSFNAVRYFEDIPVKDETMEKNDAPDMYYILYRDIIVFDHHNSKITLITLQPSSSDCCPVEGDPASVTPSSLDELLKTMALASKHHIIVVIKGAYSKIVLPNGQIFVNPTGNPGMATAGSGDVLTGMILSLLAQGYSPADAALLGVYLHGLAGDLAASNLGMESVLASDIVNHIPSAFKKVKELDIKGWGR